MFLVITPLVPINSLNVILFNILLLVYLCASSSEDVISVWNRSASNSEGIEKIKETVKRILKIPPSVNVRIAHGLVNCLVSRRFCGCPISSWSFLYKGAPWAVCSKFM